jgi:hypothetical protein
MHEGGTRVRYVPECTPDSVATQAGDSCRTLLPGEQKVEILAGLDIRSQSY